VVPLEIVSSNPGAAQFRYAGRFVKTWKNTRKSIAGDSAILRMNSIHLLEGGIPAFILCKKDFTELIYQKA
jgi:hypothetical protein